VGTEGEGSAPAGDIRRELGLRSTWFRVGVLSLPQPAKPHVFGGISRVTGVGRGVESFQLEHRSPSGWRTVATPKVAKDGAFSVAVRPTSTAEYRLATGFARTAAIRLGVAPQVRLRPVIDPMELRGTMRPAIVGAGVEIQRLNGQTWRTVGRATVAEGGTFTAPMHVPPASYRALVPTPGRGLVAGTSQTLVVSG